MARITICDHKTREEIRETRRYPISCPQREEGRRGCAAKGDGEGGGLGEEKGKGEGPRVREVGD